MLTAAVTAFMKLPNHRLHHANFALVQPSAWSLFVRVAFSSNLNATHMRRISGKMLCLVAGVKFRIEGLDKRVSSGPKYTPHITMFAHPSNLDPVVLLATSPVTHKVAGKQVRHVLKTAKS